MKRSASPHELIDLSINSPVTNNSWRCPKCSFDNHPDLPTCEVCDYSFLAVKTPSNASAPSLENTTAIPFLGDYSTVPEKYSENISTELFRQRGETTGLIPLLDNFFARNQIAGALCSRCSHFTQLGTYGSKWSCGYRNIQMLCSTLIAIPTYRRVLFNGSGVVPSIEVLQQWIEKAWSDGFDTEGATHFNSKLLGTHHWVGTTECATLLRYFGLRAVIVDFAEINSLNHDNSGGSGVATGLNRISPYIEDDNKDIWKGNAQEIEESDENTELITSMGERIARWVAKYFLVYRDRKAESTEGSKRRTAEKERLPVYFQHQGHSRTIVGFSYALAKEDKNSMKHYPSFSSSSKIKPADYLYVFDPSSNGLRIHDSLERGNLQWRRQVRKPISAINKSQYQLLYVAEGLMDDAEKERSKILIGISDSSELLASF